MNIRKVLEAGKVVRYHSTLIDKKQNNAEHQWETATILCHIFPEAKAHLVLYALTHDSGEIFTGDIPAPVKKHYPEIKKACDEMEKVYMQEELGLPLLQFSQRELLAVKYADILSGIYFTTGRINAGDRAAIEIRDKWIEYIGSLPFLSDKVATTIEELKK